MHDIDAESKGHASFTAATLSPDDETRSQAAPIIGVGQRLF
jgi:hypothetical protein